MKERLSPAAQLLLWAYDRGSLGFDLLCLILVLTLLLVPAGFWNDPLLDGPPSARHSAPAGQDVGR